jgi:hypothetical protein
MLSSEASLVLAVEKARAAEILKGATFAPRAPMHALKKCEYIPMHPQEIYE